MKMKRNNIDIVCYQHTARYLFTSKQGWQNKEQKKMIHQKNEA